MSYSGKAVLFALALLLAATGCGETNSRDSVREKRINDPVRRESVSARLGDLHLQAVRIETPVDGAHLKDANSALFLTIANAGRADRLVAVSSVDARSVVARNGSGVPEAGVDVAVPARGVASMQSVGGMHLELVGLTRDLGKRTFVPVMFRFARAGATTVNVFVSGVEHGVVPPLPSSDDSG